MIVHKCDSCGRIINDPHSAKMKEFVVTSRMTEYGTVPDREKRKVVVDLCDNCFKGLCNVVERRLQSNKEDIPSET